MCISTSSILRSIIQEGRVGRSVARSNPTTKVLGAVKVISTLRFGNRCISQQHERRTILTVWASVHRLAQALSLSSLLALSGPIMKGCCPVLGWEVRSLRTLPQQSQEAKPTADPKDAAQRAASCARARIGAQLCRPFDLCLNCIRMRRVSGIRDACPFP